MTGGFFTVLSLISKCKDRNSLLLTNLIVFYSICEAVGLIMQMALAIQISLLRHLRRHIRRLPRPARLQRALLRALPQEHPHRLRLQALGANLQVHIQDASDRGPNTQFQGPARILLALLRTQRLPGLFPGSGPVLQAAFAVTTVLNFVFSVPAHYRHRYRVAVLRGLGLPATDSLHRDLHLRRPDRDLHHHRVPPRQARAGRPEAQARAQVAPTTQTSCQPWTTTQNTTRGATRWCRRASSASARSWSYSTK